MTLTCLVFEEQSIKAIHWNNDDGSAYIVGKEISKIIPYSDDGPFGLMPWLAVYVKDDKLISRVPAWQVSIEYDV